VCSENVSYISERIKLVGNVGYHIKKNFVATIGDKECTQSFGGETYWKERETDGRTI
jgi:hypothetical protein